MGIKDTTISNYLQSFKIMLMPTCNSVSFEFTSDKDVTMKWFVPASNLFKMLFQKDAKLLDSKEFFIDCCSNYARACSGGDAIWYIDLDTYAQIMKTIKYEIMPNFVYIVPECNGNTFEFHISFFDFNFDGKSHTCTDAEKISLLSYISFRENMKYESFSQLTCGKLSFINDYIYIGTHEYKYKSSQLQKFMSPLELLSYDYDESLFGPIDTVKFENFFSCDDF